MKDKALRDMIPLALLSVLCLVSGTMAPGAILACIVCAVYQGLYQIGQITPVAVYSPRPKGKDGFFKQMYKESHPIFMPSFIYTLLGLFYLFGGIMVLGKGLAFGKLFGLFLLPVSIYFWNWSSLSFKMAQIAKHYQFKERETIQTSSSQNTKEASEAAIKVAKKAGQAARQVIQSQPVQDLKNSLAQEVKKSLQPKSQTKPDPKVDNEAARQEKIMRTLEQQVLEQIEKNDQELRSIRSTSVTALDSIFGGSEITKARFQQGIDKAIEMSKQNLAATKEYVKVGHNPEVLQKFLNRSNLINKETGDLLDALVQHQQNQMEESLQGLTDSLDELQDSLKYYS